MTTSRPAEPDKMPPLIPTTPNKKGLIVMAELDKVAQATLFSEDNKPFLAEMLERALQQPLTPMEPAQAKSYMERVAQQVAEDDNAQVQLFQMVQLKSSESTYVMRVALFDNRKAMGLDLMDAENGQFFVPESCPVVALATPSIN
jgi:hypothetical protein